MMLEDFHRAVRKENDMPSSNKQLILCLPIKAWTVEIGECEVKDHGAGGLPQGWRYKDEQGCLVLKLDLGKIDLESSVPTKGCTSTSNVIGALLCTLDVEGHDAVPCSP
jgi:hypothetical protein